ncbi:MAG: 50S ribosomal protein L21 [candidate division WWE3 bacterium]|nr:50S ribosomal protein L21 [candidate division WWE3 bacterium]
MDFAIIRFNGKQHTVTNGDVFKVQRTNASVKPEVLLWSADGKVEIGTPTLTGHEVKIEILEDKLDKKVNVSRFKAKSRERKHKGFRQPISAVKISI